MIIPTIFALDNETFQKKLKLCSKLSEILHIDFCDGEFVKTVTVPFNDMKIDSSYSNLFQVHLMAYNPKQYILQLKSLNIKTVLIQFEVFNNELDLLDTIKEFRNNDFELGLVINPDTKVGDFLKYVKFFDIVMFMSVYPGKEGQQFIETVIDKIRQLRLLNSKIIIQVDGGINAQNILSLKKNGADRFCIGSFISSSENPLKNFNLLTKKIS